MNPWPGGRCMDLARRSVLLVAALCLVACSEACVGANRPLPTSESQLSRLTAAAVVELAMQEAQRSGQELENFEAPVAKFSWHGTEATWHVDFWGRISQPGNHFSVDIEDRSGIASLHPGR